MADTDEEARLPLAGGGPDNLVLPQLAGMRREFSSMLENQRRLFELVAPNSAYLDEGFETVRRDIREIKLDLITLENRILNNDTEILRVLRRLDEAGLPKDDHP